MTRTLLALLVLSTIAATGCSKRDAIPAAPTADLAAEGVIARLVEKQIEVRNEHGERIYFATLERRYFETALALWCFGHPQCGVVLDPGTSKRVEVAQIAGLNEASTEVIVFWWSDRPPGDGRATDVKQIVVRLR